MIEQIDQTVTDPTAPLLQYGALGVFAAVLVIAVRVLFKRETDTLDRERKRADDLSGELRDLRDKIQDRYLGTLEEASGAIREAIAIIRSGSGHSQ